MLCYLSTKLTSYTSTAACNKNCLSCDEVEYLFHICLYRISSQEIFNGYILHLTSCNLAKEELIHSWQVLDLTICLLTDINKISLLLCRCTWYRNINLIYIILLYCCKYLILTADNWNSFYIIAPLCLIIINDTNYLFFNFLCIVYVTKNHLSSSSCTYYHYLWKILALYGAHFIKE